MRRNRYFRHPLNDLLDALDALAADGYHVAARFASRVRRGDVQSCVEEVTGWIYRCGALARTTKVCSAFADYYAAAHGVDLRTATEFARARQAHLRRHEAQERARQRVVEIQSRGAERANRRALAVLHASAERRR